jgi:hypothetical protein
MGGESRIIKYYVACMGRFLCGKTPLNFCSRSTSRLSTFSASYRLTFFSPYLYEKDERALPGNLHSQNFIFKPSLHLLFPPVPVKGCRYVCLLRRVPFF